MALSDSSQRDSWTRVFTPDSGVLIDVEGSKISPASLTLVIDRFTWMLTATYGLNGDTTTTPVDLDQFIDRRDALFIVNQVTVLRRLLIAETTPQDHRWAGQVTDVSTGITRFVSSETKE